MREFHISFRRIEVLILYSILNTQQKLIYKQWYIIYHHLLKCYCSSMRETLPKIK